MTCSTSLKITKLSIKVMAKMATVKGRTLRLYVVISCQLLQVLVKIMDSPSWDDLVTKMIIKPLGMQNTGNSFNSSVMDKMAVGYYPDGSLADMIDIGWDASAGQMYSSTADLAKLMTLAFSTDGSSDTQVTADRN